MIKTSSMQPKARVIPLVKAENLIPKGHYCYEPIGFSSDLGVYQTKPCPFFKIIEDRPEQANGWCDYLKAGDIEMNGTLLWDAIKECGINQDCEAFE